MREELTPLDRNTAALNRVADSLDAIAEAILKSVECPEDAYEERFPGPGDSGPPAGGVVHNAAEFASTAAPGPAERPVAIPVQMAGEPDGCVAMSGCCRSQPGEGRHRRPEGADGEVGLGVEVVAR